ncbi:hypothetical protein [Singulisphaera sp. PoT]|uniref:hypothetical protein n=1 Tax=Singulisphaera sp. PoT TaxID=3411797 RepID=UPI003BF5ABB3
MSRSLRTEWLSFSHQVIPHDAERAQITEMRRAFYAGAIAAISMLDEISRADLNTEDEATRLTALWSELEAYRRDLKAGKA